MTKHAGMVNPCLKLLGIAKLFSKVAVPCAIPTRHTVSGLVFFYMLTSAY